jgi:hypothetical protein
LIKEPVVPSELLRRFQARFLRELFRSPKSGFVLKGGLALNALYGSSRLTMEIDLDFPPHGKRTADSLHSQIERAIHGALTGMQVGQIRLSAPGKAEVSPQWKVSGIAPDGSPFHVKVEVSRRPPVPAGPTKQHALRSELAPGLPVFYVDVYDESTLAAMKLAALLAPNRLAPRDVYDLDLLIADGHHPSTAALRDLLIVLRIAESGAADLLESKFDGMGWDEFSAQVLSALGQDEAARFSPDEWDAMKGRVLAATRRWLRELEESRQ